MKFLSVQTDKPTPSVTVLATDEAAAEIFAQEKASKEYPYFENMTAGAAWDVSEFYKSECQNGFYAFLVKFY